MISALFLYLILSFLPPAIVLYARCHFKTGVNSNYFILVLLNVVAVSLLAPLCYWIEFGLAKYVLIIGVAVLLDYYLAWFLLSGMKKQEYSFGRIALFCLLLSLGTFLIYGASGWSFQNMNWFHGGEGYFRPPFTHDIERNVIITNALIRKSETPYLPYGNFAYQLLWYHVAAVIVSLYPGVAHYPQVAGVIVGTALLFFFSLLSLVALLRPDVFKSKWFCIFLPVLFFHADLWNGIKSLKLFGAWTVDEIAPVFFRYVSFQSMSVVSPQHCLFIVLLIGFILPVRCQLFDNENSKIRWQNLFVISSFLCSPILSGIIFPFYAVHEGWGSVKKGALVKRWSLLLISACLVHWILLRYSPASLLFRPTGERILFPTGTLEHLWFLPLAPILSSGILGILFLLTFIRECRARRYPSGAEAIFILTGTILFQFVITHSEIRRYFSMIAAFVILVYVLDRLPSLDLIQKRVALMIPSLSLVVLACFSQGYFYKFYLFEPSTLNATIPWKDYFAMNAWIENRRLFNPTLELNNQRILAASSMSLGLEKPFVMEVATSFSSPAETAIHTKLSPQQFELIKLVHAHSNAVPFATYLGYDQILWGPVEELVWGKLIREQFVNFDRPIARTGSVGLYPLKTSTIRITSATAKN